MSHYSENSCEIQIEMFFLMRKFLNIMTNKIFFKNPIKNDLHEFLLNDL